MSAKAMDTSRTLPSTSSHTPGRENGEHNIPGSDSRSSLGDTGNDDDDGDISQLQDNIMKQSRTIDDFTRIIADWRSDREKRQMADGASIRASLYGPQAAGEPSTSALSVRGLNSKRSVSSLRRDADRRQSLDVDGISQYSYDVSSVGDRDEDDVSLSASPAGSLSPLAMQENASSRNVKVRCTCCCGRGTRKCKRARRATREWGEVESDLRLAAEIGQALLRRNDSLQNELAQAQHDHSARIDGLMKKLTHSIREVGLLERAKEQSDLNEEAADASNRSLVRELDECRKEVMRLRSAVAKHAGLDERLENVQQELSDSRQELAEEIKRRKKLERVQSDLQNDLRLAKLEATRSDHSKVDEASRQEKLRLLIEAKTASTERMSEDRQWSEALLEENAQLHRRIAELSKTNDTQKQEIASLKEEQQHDSSSPNQLAVEKALPNAGHLAVLSDEMSEHALPPPMARGTHPSSTAPSSLATMQSPASQPISLTSEETMGTEGGAKASVIDAKTKAGSFEFLSAPPNLASQKAAKEMRTSQLMALLDAIQRIFARLSSADVETLTKRLQRQNLAGDVGHLARTTVSGIVRDVEGLRDQFRRAMEQEARNRDKDDVSTGSKGSSGKGEKESDSLIARKEFFALIKIFRELFLEIARLRKTVNEVSLQPLQAAKILQDQLGVTSVGDTGMGAWIGKLFTAAPVTASSYNATAVTAHTATAAAPGSNRPATSRVTSGPQLTSRAAAAVLPSTVAVEVKGSHAGEQITRQAGPSTSPMLSTSPAELPSHARLQAPFDQQRGLSRRQSQNLNGLFVGSQSGKFGDRVDDTEPPYLTSSAHPRLASEGYSHRQHRLSRVVDDDELSIHQSYAPKMGRRPRNLSDSSIRTTYLEDEDRVPSRRTAAPAAISRIITPSTLALQAPSYHDAGVMRSSTSATFSEDSASTASKNSIREANPATSTSSFFTGITAPRATVTKALSFLTGPSVPASTVSQRTSLAAPQPRTLRSTSSSARLSLAAAAAPSSSSSSGKQSSGTADDYLRGYNRAKDLGF